MVVHLFNIDRNNMAILERFLALSNKGQQHKSIIANRDATTKPHLICPQFLNLMDDIHPANHSAKYSIITTKSIRI